MSFSSFGKTRFGGLSSPVSGIKGFSSSPIFQNIVSETDPFENLANTVLILNFENEVLSSAGQWSVSGPDYINSPGTPTVTFSTTAEDVAFGTYGYRMDERNASGYGNALTPLNDELQFGTGDFTIEVFAKVDSNRCGLWQMDDGSVTGNRMGLGVWEFSGNTIHVRGTSGPSQDNFALPSTSTHICLERKNGNMVLMVDGSQVGSTVENTNELNFTRLLLGGYNVDSFDYTFKALDGALDAMRITKGIARYKGATSIVPPQVPYLEPIALSNYSKAAVDETTVQVSVDTTGIGGTLYYVAYNSNTYPTPAQMKSGEISEGNNYPSYGTHTVTSSGTQTFNVDTSAFTSSEATSAYIYFYHEDENGIGSPIQQERNIDSFTYVELTGSGSWTVPENLSNIPSLLLVAGGGGGASNQGGGGGAGGVVLANNVSVTPSSSISYSVGIGGSGGPNSSRGNGTNGSNTSIDIAGIDVAIGGGAGSGSFEVNGFDGGSGGGGDDPSTSSLGGSGVAGQGNDGGNDGGGGGGFSQVGQRPNGGAGFDASAIFPTSYGDSGWFAGGGACRPGNGGQGGGGNGGLDALGQAAQAGMSKTGGGGGGGSNSYRSGGAGGSGVILIKYLDF